MFSRLLILVTFISAANAFVPGIRCKSQQTRVTSKYSKPSSPRQLNMIAYPAIPATMKAVVPVVAKLTASNSFKNAIAIPIMYALMSLNEYVTHRYYQHAEFNKNSVLQTLFFKFQTDGGGHVEHHAETLDDMSLKTDDRWLRTPAASKLNSDPFRGTAFTWPVTLIMFFQMLITAIPIYKNFLGFSLPSILGMTSVGLLIHTSVWNALHPSMHYLPDVPSNVGPPSGWLNGFKNTWFFKYLYQNHEGHHVLGGQANYNVCCPGADHLFGSYVKEADWRPKMRPVAPDRETNKSPNNVYEKYCLDAVTV